MRSPINQDDLRSFEQCYIPQETIIKAGIFRVDDKDGAEIVGRKPKRDTSYSGLAFPYIWPGDNEAREYRLRRDQPDLEKKNDGTLRVQNKYLSPPGRGNILYFHPDTNPDWLKSYKPPVVIVEGEKKTLALQNYFTRRAEESLVIGLAGVWGWRGKIGIVTNEAGVRQRVKGVVADIERIQWDGRRVEILFDADAKNNPQVKAARQSLALQLRLRGAIVRLLEMPDLAETNCNGIDDLLGAKGPDYVAEWLQSQRQLPAVDIDLGYTDDGFLHRFYDFCGHRFLYVPEWDKWLAWDGEKWDGEHGEALLWQAIGEAALELQSAEEATANDPEKCQKFFAKYRSTNGKRSLVETAKRDMRFRKSSAEFDVNPWLINCKNGTLDLRTGTLKPFDRTDYFTQQIEINYSPDAKCPTWEQFIEQVIPEPEMRLYIQRATGYSLTGCTSEQCMFICYGGGSNGKSTFVEAIEYILKSYHVKAAMTTFSVRENENTSDLARMRPARFVTVSENDENARLSEGLIKTATGDKEITARFLYQNPFTYTPLFKVWMCVNHRPVIRGQDDGIWRRLKLIPFEVKITDDKKDKELGGKLRAEAEGILAWAVRGCLDWQKSGLDAPQQIKSATDGYREEMDTMGRWIDERCELDDEFEENATDLYTDFAEWAKKMGENPLNNTIFGRRMGDRGFQVGRKSHDGRRMRKGIRLIRIR